MNASRILDQIMMQAGSGRQGSGQSGGGLDVQGVIDSLSFEAPLGAEALARQADSPQAAREMYLISVAVIDDQNPMERAWLDQLGGALGLDEGMRQEIERQVLGA
ncbi:Inner membrane protein YebE [Halomonas lysinitropha]|uniref:Inner membrane protein YebE n=1 Tax=Halomonas lysinitropha TaxID=2607506 RepID=A0A5K1IA17_9GAMM|nr:Inner membrane protein YebE [Halomonas lysinitropha]